MKNGRLVGDRFLFQFESNLHEQCLYPFLLTERGMSYRRLMDEILARRFIEIQPVLEFGQANLICELAEQNIGISFLPNYVTDAVRRGTVVRLDVQGFEPELLKQLLYHRDKRVSPQMQAVTSHLTGISLSGA